MPLTRIFVDAHLLDYPVSRAIQQRIGMDAIPISSASTVYDWVCAAEDPIRRGKETLYLTENRGAFIRECPGTRFYTCCGYTILHIGTYCAMDCAYCILQAYFHPPVLQLFLNIDQMKQELASALHAGAVRRIGTGEFTDSLIWEWWMPYSGKLIDIFAQQSRACLELKTKTTAIDALAECDHRHKTILAWSLNTEPVIRENERGTAALAARIRAAATCAGRGYPVAFHFDPMVIYDGCIADYRRVIEQLFDQVPAEQVVWISMGTFRFMPGLKQIVQRRFPDSGIVYGEFIQGLDQKMRYFKPLRIQLYRAAYAAIQERAPRVTNYLCMEDEEVWQKAFGFVPASKGGLPAMLDRAAIRHCGLERS